MKSMFQVSPFGSPRFGGYSPALGQVRLAQGGPVAPLPDDQPEISAITGGIEGLLKQLPAEALGTYNAKYQACQTQLTNGGAVGMVAGGKCLVDLYKEIQNFIKNGPPKALPPAPAATGDLVLPIVIGLAGLGVLIWGLSKL